MAANDDVLRKAGGLREDPRAQRPDADPRAGGELEVLGQAAIEDEALARIVGIDELHRVAEPIEAFFVEGRGGEGLVAASSPA